MADVVRHAMPTGEKLKSAARNALTALIDLALPPVCPTCREPVAGTGGLCARCWAKLSFITRPHCERLGTPFLYDQGAGMLSMQAIADPPAYGRARAAVRYDEIARTLVHALKYGDRLELAPTMGRWMVQAGRDLLEQADVLVPVPLHWQRLWLRRFNQAALLADVIAAASNIAVHHCALRRVRATPQQVGLARAARATNMQAAFRVPETSKMLIHGKRIILIDDVLTSGATVDTCARALFRGGANAVDVLVFACVVDATV